MPGRPSRPGAGQRRAWRNRRREGAVRRLETGQIAAAGLDAFAQEPRTDSPLFELENVVATPHLGASTEEAQEKAGDRGGPLGAPRALRWLVPDAVNVQVGVIAEDVRPGIPLVEKLGRIFTALAGEVAQQIDVEVRGEITEFDVKVLELGRAQGRLRRHRGGAGLLRERAAARRRARHRGPAVTESESPDHRNLITIRGTLADGSQVSVSGTLIGLAQKERLVEVNDFVVDLEPTDHLAFFTYEDRPGMVGTVGRSSAMPRSTSPACRSPATAKGGQALVALSVDSAVPTDVLDEIRDSISARVVRGVDLSGSPSR